MTKEICDDFRETIKKQWNDILSASTLEEYGEATYQFYKPESVELRIKRSLHDVENLILDKLKREPNSSSIKINNLIEYTMFKDPVLAKGILESRLKDYLGSIEEIDLEDVKFKEGEDEVIITWKKI